MVAARVPARRWRRRRAAAKFPNAIALPSPASPRVIALETPSSLLFPEQGEESGSPVRDRSRWPNGEAGRAVFSPPPWGLLSSPLEGGRSGGGLTRAPRPGRGAFPIPLIRELPGSAGVPPAWRAGGPHPPFRASREAGGTRRTQGRGPPSRPPPERGIISKSHNGRSWPFTTRISSRKTASVANFHAPQSVVSQGEFRVACPQPRSLASPARPHGEHNNGWM